MAESWTPMSVTQPESRTTDTKARPPQELSDPCPFTSDIIRLQRKEVELLQKVVEEEVEADLQNSCMSDKELPETRAECYARVSPVLSLEESDLEPPEAVELLLCMEEPEVEDMMEWVPQTTFTPATPLPESPDFFSMTEIGMDALHRLPYPQEPSLFSKPALFTEPVPESFASPKSECADKSSACEESSASPTEENPLAAKPSHIAPTACAELPVVLIGGAALVAAVIIMKYVWTRK
ncbi:uncharacterized protein LOC143513869 [Brachyhypopomus gauderio]|uniref:uncharacterized protein LOC143513869 n=1 Tax=Brachyhypopomus gauderio TaxID=698409 RepID=UPI004042B16B